jgi:hypothetical protein
MVNAVGTMGFPDHQEGLDMGFGGKEVLRERHDGVEGMLTHETYFRVRRRDPTREWEHGNGTPTELETRQEILQKGERLRLLPLLRIWRIQQPEGGLVLANHFGIVETIPTIQVGSRGQVLATEREQGRLLFNPDELSVGTGSE